jgi:hypothetical protein
MTWTYIWKRPCSTIISILNGMVTPIPHINRAKTKLLTGRINSEKGYGAIVICTAKEVLDDE